MAEAVADGAEAPNKGAKLPLLAGLAAALILGAGGFWAVYSGMILGPTKEPEVGAGQMSLDEIAFVPIESILVTLPPGARASHLRLTAQLEVAKGQAAGVAELMPRILDVLNSYLRAVDVADIEDPSAMARLRAQMLRRVQLVSGEGRVRDLLVTEFVLN